MRRSIRTRLIVGILALLVPLWIAAGWLLVEVFGNRLLRDMDVSLQEEAETVAEVATTATNSTALTDLISRIAGGTGFGVRKYVVVLRQGQVVAEAPAGALAMLDGRDPDVRVARYESPGSPLTVSIGVSAAAAIHAKRRLTSLLAAGIPLTLLLLGAGLWLIIGRALRPLANAARRLDAVDAASLSLRLPVENADDEVGRMVTVVNRMLDRLQGAVAELQRFSADASHQLRTPLTVLRAGLDVALARDRSAEEYRAALREALASTDRMWRLAGDLLTLARLEAAGLPRETARIDLAEVLSELADASAASAAQQRLSLDVQTSSALWVRGDAGDLYRLFNSLIENAIRHSAAGGRVQLSASRQGDTCEVTIADDCPGIATADLGRIFERFYRGNGARADAAGSGLGLSIAQQIARTHGGHITASNRSGRGCVLTVTLPAD